MAPKRRWRTGPPDFIGVGAQRSGTTWWFRNLRTHPGIRAPRARKKELHFFDRFCVKPMTDEDIERYHRLMPRKRRQIAGEWTPRYMSDVWVPPLLKRAAPEAKLLVMLRDPIERLRSGLPHRLSMGRMPMMDRLTYDAIQRGRYGTQVRRLLHWYDRDQVIFLQYEQCVRDPIEHYGRTLRFLGADDSFVPEDMRKPRGVSRESAKEPMLDHFLAGAKATLDPEVELLGELLPDFEIDLWPNFRDLVAAKA